MSDALITKYRPQGFDQVIGQAAVIRSVQASLKSGSSRMFLYSGPPGVGKTTLARLTAVAAGCPINAITEIDGASQTGIDDMRAVTSTLIYRPVGETKIKALIVDEAQSLSKSAITSLLKVLEEPPEHVYWLLCTTEPTKIPDSVRTRAAHYQLKPVAFEDLAALLDGVVEAEKLPTPQEVVDLCAAEAEGSPRQALSNLAVCAVAKNLTEAQVLLRSAAEPGEAVNLARALVNNASWAEVQKILNGLTDTSPESIRHVVRAYVTKVVLGAKKEATAGRGIEILDAFSTPCHTADGLSPIVLACGKLLLG